MMVFTTPHLLLSLLLITHAKHATSRSKRKPICADPSTGTFVALAVDEDTYDSIPGVEGRSPNDNDDSPIRDPQQWKLVYEGDDKSREIHGSFEGQYLQILPDGGRSYPGRGKHLHDVRTLEGVSPYLSFTLKVQQKGWHTLFVRWTGGDGFGGGDSFYVTLMKAKSKEIVRGQRTLKPATVPINSGIDTYAGCCYNTKTHACPCFKTVPSEDVCNSTYFINRERASEFGAQCRLGIGVMTMVPAPQWYLFAGQDVGNVMDFDSQPWDATCEAEGSNTADSGHDFPSWELSKGEYELRFYAREDGTALDALYVAGPNGEAPGVLQRYRKGDSTYCPRFRSRSKAAVFGWGFMIATVLGLIGVLLVKTEKGRELTERLVGSINGNVSDARSYIQQYDRSDQLYEHPSAEMLSTDPRL